MGLMGPIEKCFFGGAGLVSRGIAGAMQYTLPGWSRGARRIKKYLFGNLFKRACLPKHDTESSIDLFTGSELVHHDFGGTKQSKRDVACAHAPAHEQCVLSLMEQTLVVTCIFFIAQGMP